MAPDSKNSLKQKRKSKQKKANQLRDIKSAQTNEKTFDLQYVLNFNADLSDGNTVVSKEEEYFNMMWSINIKKHEKSVNVMLRCRKADNVPDISLNAHFSVQIYLTKTEYDQEIAVKNFQHEFKDGEEKGDQMIAWDKVRKHNEQFAHTVVVSVKIMQTICVGLNSASLYRQTKRDMSVAEIEVQKCKFFIRKRWLAKNSKFFSNLFKKDKNNNAISSQKTVFHLSQVDVFDFGNLIDVQSRAKSLDDFNIEGVLFLADQFKMDSLVLRCKDYLITESKKSVNKKFQLAIQYKWGKLKYKCITSCKTTNALHYMIPSYKENYGVSSAQINWETLHRQRYRKRLYGAQYTADPYEREIDVKVLDEEIDKQDPVVKRVRLRSS